MKVKPVVIAATLVFLSSLISASPHSQIEGSVPAALANQFAAASVKGAGLETTNDVLFVNFTNPRMVVNLTTYGNPVMVYWTIYVRGTVLTGSEIRTQLLIDGAVEPGAERGTTTIISGGASISQTATIALTYLKTGLSAGGHTFEMQWTTTGTGLSTALDDERQLAVVEL